MRGAPRRSRQRREGPETQPVPMPGTIGSALSRLVALKGLAHSRGDAQLEETWKDLAGSRIAERTALLGLDRGVLHVGVSSSAMLGELSAFHKGRLLEDLREREPRLKLRDIKFRLRRKSGFQPDDP